MRLKWSVVPLLCVAFALSCLAGGVGTVGGQVLSSNGKPAVDARVILQASDGGYLQTAQTNADGKFWFAELPEGQYDVRASDNGRVSEWRQNVWVSPGKQTNITLHLHGDKSK